YVMGKDNITFHTVLWPAILMGAGDYHLPDDIVASEFLHMEGRKFSTSRGQVIYVKDVLDRYDADALRYYLMIAGPENQDTDFTWDEFVRRNNDELVATWGNLVHRTLVNAHRNFAAVPEPGAMTAADETLLLEVEKALEYVGQQLQEARFQNALKHAMAMASRVNVYLGAEQPWHTIKTDRERAGTVLYVALRCVDNLKTMLAPFLPFSTQKLHSMLGYEDVIAPQPEVKDLGDHRIKPAEPDFASLRRMAEDEMVVVIGEIGLDFEHVGGPNNELQVERLNELFSIATDLNLPVSVHNRGATHELLQAISAHRGIRGVMHYFALDWEWAQRFLEGGFYLSFAGLIRVPGRGALRA